MAGPGSLYEAMITNRFVKESPWIQNKNNKALLFTTSIAMMLAATVGQRFFKLDNTTAAITFGAGALTFVSACSETDGPLYLVGIAALTGVGTGVVQAMRDGRVVVDLSDLLRLGYDIFRDCR